MSQGELLATPALPLPKATATAEPAISQGHMSLASLVAEQRAKAAAVVVSDEQLAAWYADQLATQEAYVAKLVEALTKANSDPRLGDAKDPVWGRYHLLEARYRYAEDTLALLRSSGHVLVCPVHGIESVEVDAEGLSMRGHLTGEGALAWTRWDEPCAKSGPISTVAKSLQRDHERRAG